LTSPPVYRTPFDGWTSAAAPAWWRIHNRLKHNRLKHLRLATVEVALGALAGALLAIATTPELVRALVRRGWLETGPWNIEYAIEFAEAGFAKADFTLDTKLFAIPLGPTPLPEDVHDFTPRTHTGSLRLRAFFLRL
jgi:hypothetical protein